MSQLMPLIYGSAFYGILFLFLPCFIKKGPNQGVIRCSLYLTIFSLWIFWATVYISQMNPLIGPRHGNITLIWLKQKEESATTTTPPSDLDTAVEGTAAKALRTRPQYCQYQPDNLFECCNIPWLPKRALATCMGEHVDILTLTCEQAKCAVKEAGWLERPGMVKNTLITAYYDKIMKTDEDWTRAVNLVKADCLEIKVKYQGIHMNCPEYDIIYCAMIRMFKHGPLKTWSTAASCVSTQKYTSTCPICPQECTKGEFKDSTMLCEACLIF